MTLILHIETDIIYFLVDNMPQETFSRFLYYLKILTYLFNFADELKGLTFSCIEKISLIL